MTLMRFLRFAGWPAATGFLAAVLVLVGHALWRDGVTVNVPFLDSRDATASTAHNLNIPQTLTEPDEWGGVVSYRNAVKRASPSVVNIYTQAVETRRPSIFDHPFFQQMFNNSELPVQKRMQSTLGSGVIVSESGYILTNNHVINGADEILVSLSDGRETRARLIGADEEYDLAVLKIDLDNLTAITVGLSSELEVGDVVLAIGNPFGYGQTVTQGIVSATSRFGRSGKAVHNYIQTDAALIPGYSGGALIDAYGNLVGINSAVTAQDNSYGISFAIPADIAIRVQSDIVEFGRAIRGWLGVEAERLTPGIAQRLGVKSSNGVVITQINDNSPAELAGLQPLDVITRINGQAIVNIDILSAQISQIRPGEKVQFEIWRNGEPRNVEAVIVEKPDAS